MSRLDFLVLVLQTSNGFHLDSLSFQVFLYFNPYCLRGPWSIDTCGVLCFPLGFFWKVKNIVSVLFTVWNLQTGFPLKPMFSEGPSFFVLFVCNEREMKMRLKVEALPTSWYRVMTSQDYIKVEHIRTWLLSSSLAMFQKFESECFFQVCFILFLPAYMVHVQFFPLWSCFPFVLFSLLKWTFWSFWSEIFKRLLDETYVFGKVFHFLYLFLVMELWVCACTW